MEGGSCGVEAIHCITNISGHCGNEMRSSEGARTVEAQATGSKAKLADMDRGSGHKILTRYLPQIC
jgi:hypothetical protein